MYSRYKELVTIDKIIERDFYSPYEEDILLEYACKGLVTGLGDIYSGYYSDDDLDTLMGNITSEYVGIGITVSKSGDGNIKIINVDSGTPADIAGLKIGDIITYVDGISVSGVGFDEALKIVKSGDAGTNVVLTIKRGENTIDITAVRENMHETTVFYNMLENAVAYIRISKFNMDTGDMFEKTVKQAENDGAQKIILDLRDNPGGESESAEKVADCLLDKCTMYYSINKQGKKNVVKAEKGCTTLPLAVLVNGSSGSASELVAGALKDNGRGYIIGQTTFGKGIIQAIYEVSKTTALKLTVAEYFTPSGNKVHGVGIIPDYELVPDDGLVKGDITSDNQLKYAVSYLTKDNDE